jgi:CPA1 family monovalent cation:H+ antiporter
MNIVTIATILVTLCAVFSYINDRFIKLPPTIGIMAMTLALSTAILLLPHLGIDVLPVARGLVASVDFSRTVLDGMLAFLLFAGALHVDWQTLRHHKGAVFSLAFFGTVFSAATVGVAIYYAFPLFGLHISFIYALLFGAVISPTDPIAVIAILKKAGIPRALEITVVGESLLNDGVAVVLFLALLEISGGAALEASDIALLFVREALGGMALGGALGWIVLRMLRSIDSYKVEIFLTLALAMGGYELADTLHCSGPLAVVVAGLIVGNAGRGQLMSDTTKKNLDNFWELVDEFLNAGLFLLLGLELLLLPSGREAFAAGLFMIPVLLVIRCVSVVLPMTALKRFRDFIPGTIPILTWGGLRGGLSVALVLALPAGDGRDALLLVTYCIVVFSIMVQGLTIGKLAARYGA